MKIRLLILLALFGFTLKGQVINRMDNINNFIICDITGIDQLRVSYNHDTSTVWFSNLGFNPDSLQKFPPDTMNVVVGKICYLSVYQVGIEYPFLQAIKDHPYFLNPNMLHLIMDSKNEGWVLIRKEPVLFASFKLIRKLIKMYYI